MKIALIGAGGKMGVRLANNLKTSAYDVSYVEVSEAGRNRVKEATGKDCVPIEDGLQGAEAVVLAVPDTAIKAVSAQVVPQMAPGSILVILDAAAPYAGHLPEREDVTYFVTHPCHPPIFNDESTVEASERPFRRDRGAAGDRERADAGAGGALRNRRGIAKTIWAPILRSHRVTVDEMAMLEPGLSETVCATLLAAMKDAMDEVVRRGVDPVCARDFLIGHMNILAAVTFEEIPGVFSDACNKAIVNGKPRIFRDDWLGVFEPAEIAESIRRIT